jgi:hypothetical protein
MPPHQRGSGLNGDFSTDVHAVINYKSTIARLLKEQKFQELDCLADRARSGKERFPGGDWNLHTLYGGLYSPNQYPVIHTTGEEWNTYLQLLQKWVTARPKSVTGRVALARSYLNYAYDASGEGSSNTVSDSGWKLFAARTAEGKRILDAAKALSTTCPEWYVGMLLVAQNQGWRASDARALKGHGRGRQDRREQSSCHVFVRETAGTPARKGDAVSAATPSPLLGKA